MLIRNWLYRNLARVPYNKMNLNPWPSLWRGPAVVGERRGFSQQATSKGYRRVVSRAATDAAENKTLAWAEEQSLALLFLIRSTLRVYLSAALVLVE